MGVVGGDLLKAWLLAREQHGHRAESLASVIVDRLIGLYVLLVVASVAILMQRVSGATPTPTSVTSRKPRWSMTALGTLAIGVLFAPDVTVGTVSCGCLAGSPTWAGPWSD